jgi:hypothetical protein
MLGRCDGGASDIREASPQGLFPTSAYSRERDHVEILFGGLHWRAEKVIQAVSMAGVGEANRG